VASTTEPLAPSSTNLRFPSFKAGVLVNTSKALFYPSSFISWLHVSLDLILT